MALSVIFDHEQSRLSQDRIAAVAAGAELNGPYYSNTWIDPITHTLMLRPAPLFDAWFTSNAGIYAKLEPSDFDAETPLNWYEAADYKLGADQGPWIASVGEAPGGLVTTTTWAKNRAFVVSIFAYGAGDNFVLAEMGWNPTPDYLSSVGLKLYSGGDMEVWKNGSQVGLYNISGAIISDQKTNVLIDLLLIPCRRRELLVVSRQGNGFCHVFEDIEETDENPTITPASKFYVDFPTASAQVQVAPISYPTSGYATSLEYQLGEAPAVSDALETFDNPAFAGGNDRDWLLYGDPPYAGTTPTTSKAEFVTKTNTAFTPNGTARDIRVKVTIEGDSEYTPFVYGAQVAYESVNELTDNAEEASADAFVEELAIDVPDYAAGVTGRMRLFSPVLAESTIAGLRRGSNRPIKVERESVVWLDGQGMSPSFDESTQDEAQRLTLEFRDRWKSLENYMFKTRVPLDGMNLVDALKFILKRIGLVDADFDMEAVDFDIEPIPSAKAGDFNVVIEIGDTAAEWVERLIEDYAANFHYGFEPTASGVKFVFKSPATLDEADFAYELWPTIQDAIDNGIAQADAWKHVYRTYSDDTLEPEANDIRVTGWDPRLQRAIQSHYPDAASQDPTTLPSARPENWLGEQRQFGLLDPGINTQAVCDRTAALIFDRLTPARVIAEIECETMIVGDVPLWRGKDVWLHGKGRFRIVSFGIDAEKEPALGDAWQWRPAVYCLERKVESES